MGDVREEKDNDYTALYRLSSIIDQLVPMVRLKDKDDKAKVRFLTNAVNKTTWRLSSLRSLPAEQWYQRLVNVLYTPMRELGTFEE